MAHQPVPVCQPSYPEAEQHPPPAVVVGPQYCAGHAVDLEIVRTVLTPTDDFEVRDVNGNVVLKVEGKLLTLHGNRLISDAYGKPLMTLRQKIPSAHSRWQVYRGDSSDPIDLLFTTKTSSMVQFKTKLNVYLAHRTSEDVCDYMVKASWTKGSCVVYVGDSTTIAAQMQWKEGGEDKFMVRVTPNIDHAFVAALILILDSVVSLTDVSKQLIKSADTLVSVFND